MTILPSDDLDPISPGANSSAGELSMTPGEEAEGLFHVVCAWCKGALPKPAPDGSSDGVSHGICRSCASQHFGVTLPGAV